MIDKHNMSINKPETYINIDCVDVDVGADDVLKNPPPCDLESFNPEDLIIRPSDIM